MKLTDNIDQISVSQSFIADLDECHKIIPLRSENLLILTQNIRSINRNISGFETLLGRLKLDCHILILTECWLSNTPVIPKLPGYCHAATKTNPKQNDGVVIYYKDYLNLQIHEPNSIESNCLVATIDKHIAIIALYRSPSYKNIDPFLSFLDTTLQQISSFTNIVIMGDINITISPNNIQMNGERYLTLAAAHGLLPAHTLITRSSSANCLDHVLLKSQYPSTTIIPQTTLTDHYPVLLHMSLKTPRHFTTTAINKIDYKGIEQNILKTDLSVIYQSEDPNFCLNYLVKCLQNILEKKY